MKIAIENPFDFDEVEHNYQVLLYLVNRLLVSESKAEGLLSFAISEAIQGQKALSQVVHDICQTLNPDRPDVTSPDPQLRPLIDLLTR